MPSLNTALRELERRGVPIELSSIRADGDRLDWDAAFAALATFDWVEATRANATT